MLAKILSVTFVLLSAASSVSSHVAFLKPPIRGVGEAFRQKCGDRAYDVVKDDPTGPIQYQRSLEGCKPTLCRGQVFDDQPLENVQWIAPGQRMNFSLNCTLAHGGPATVSLIDTSVGYTGTRIGGILKEFTNFCPGKGPIPDTHTNLTFKLPEAEVMGTKCETPGQCVVQLYQSMPSGAQTYYYCVDVAVDATHVKPITAPPRRRLRSSL